MDAEGKQQLTNLTNSGYEDIHPRWTPDGKAMLWFSDRDGLARQRRRRRLSQGDVYAMFFTQKAYDRFKLSKAEFEIVKKAEDDAKKERGQGQERPDDKDKTAKDEEQKERRGRKKKEPVEIDFEEHRGPHRAAHDRFSRCSRMRR